MSLVALSIFQHYPKFKDQAKGKAPLGLAHVHMSMNVKPKFQIIGSFKMTYCLNGV